MLQSMTAFASAAAAGSSGTLAWEVRSVNHRYLEIAPRLPEGFRTLEAAVRDRIKQRFARGKFDVTLRFETDPGDQAERLTLNRPLVRALLRQFDELVKMKDDRGSPDWLRLLSWPGVVDAPDTDFEVEHTHALALLDTALAQLADNRAREGQAIAKMLESRLQSMAEQVRLVRNHLPAVRAALQTRLRERIEALGMELDPGRLEQEVALQLTKLDVDEELDRLDAHMAEIRRILAADEPAGRRLDFLMQELNREANTLGSKSVAAETSGVSVELKVLIEQMREQIQNVE